MLISRENARLLGKIAFMGLWQGRFAESEAIFKALRDAEPKRVGPVLGLGMVQAHQGNYAEAAEIFEKQALAVDPEDEHAKAWLGLALFRDGKRDRAAAILQEVADKAEALDAKALAVGLLEEMGSA